jgi:hypothetical protein
MYIVKWNGDFFGPFPGQQAAESWLASKRVGGDCNPFGGEVRLLRHPEESPQHRQSAAL